MGDRAASDEGFGRAQLTSKFAPTRPGHKLIAALSILKTKRDKDPPKKHGNFPL